MFWIAVTLFLILLVGLLVLKQRQSRKTDGALPYKKLPFLFTPAERSFLGVLDLAVGSNFRVFGKVRVADVLAADTGLAKGPHQVALNKINRKHLDFVLCRPDDLSVRCAIELNDRSHQQKHRQNRDEFLADACRSAGLPLIMFDARRTYAAAEISARITEATAASRSERTEPVLRERIPENSPVASIEPEIAPLCPRCSSAMTKRIAKGGDNAGKEFWGCSNFPKCREIVTI